VTASGARLVIRGEAENSIALDQEAWFPARARRAGPTSRPCWLLRPSPDQAAERTSITGTANSRKPPNLVFSELHQVTCG